MTAYLGALGGEDGLRDSGAFVEVVRLRNGGFWLRATPTFEDYDMAAAEKVFRVLAPRLLPGQPLDLPDDDVPHLIVREDAANYS